MSPTRPKETPASLLASLEEILREFGPREAAQKLTLLSKLSAIPHMPSRVLARLHDCLCFVQAYPDNPRVRRAAEELTSRLRQWIALLPDGEETATLADRGFPGAVNRYPFSYAVLRRMVALHPNCLEIEWDECEDEGPIQNALVLLVSNNECQGLDDIRLTMETWAQACKADPEQSDLQLLLDIFEQAPLPLEERAFLFDSCHLPTRYRLADPGTGRAEIRLAAPRIHYQKRPIPRKRYPLEPVIRKPLDSARPLPRETATG